MRWSRENHLQLNVKMKELVILRRDKPASFPVCISGTDVEMLSNKYYDAYLDKQLEWSTNVNVVHRKGMSRLYFLRRLIWNLQHDDPNLLPVCSI